MKNNWIIALFGLSLFFLVMSVFYAVVYAAPKGLQGMYQAFAPFVELTTSKLHFGEFVPMPTLPAESIRIASDALEPV